MKTCTKCGIEKPLTEFGWRHDRNTYRSWCNPCHSADNGARHAAKRKLAGPRKVLSGADHPVWVGDAVGYHGMHQRVRTARGRADRCLHRPATGCTGRRFEWAHIHGLDPADVFSYVPLCTKCHNDYDRPQRIPAMARGERAGGAKLTEAAVVSIRERHAAGESQKSLTIEFGMSAAAICQIISRQRWGHVA